MIKYLLNKTLVFTIVILFIGTSLVSALDINFKNEIAIKDISSVDINDGLVGYWSFDFEDALDESGNDNIGTVHGVVPVDGISGRAFIYDGIDDYVDILDTTDFTFTEQSVTISCWVQIVDNPDEYRRFIVLKGSTNPHPGISLQKCRSGVNSGKLCFSVHNVYGDSSHAYSIHDGDQLPKSTWLFVVGVIDYPGTVKLYLNGDLQEAVTAVSYDMSDAYNLKLHFGVSPIVPGWHKGLLDEVRIYNRALSDDEIMELYNNPAGLKSTIMFGRVSNLNTDAGDLMTFEALKLRCIQFSPFKFVTFKAGEKLKISEEYKGFLNQNFVLGIFKTKI
jgi:hypothetical protein